MNTRANAIRSGFPCVTHLAPFGGILFLLLLGMAVWSCDRREQAASREALPQKNQFIGEPADDAYASALEKYVNDEGMVDYQALKANREPLDRYVQSLAGIDPQSYEKWNAEKKIAYWINAYNSLTLQSIIDHYPIKKGGLISGLRFPENSIRQIPGVWDEIKHTAMGKQVTLDAIEHATLRKEFHEPRIHMALVCAAKGCPALRNEPYSGERLNAQLDDQSKKFLANPQKFRIDRGKGKVYLSSIFKWFGSDFSGNYKTDQFQQAPKEARPVLDLASRYLSPEDAEYLKSQQYTIDYLDYDWSLNEQ